MKGREFFPMKMRIKMVGRMVAVVAEKPILNSIDKIARMIDFVIKVAAVVI